MPGKYVTFNFHFRPVGQGLFYTGEIQLHKPSGVHDYRFVYDCGSDKKELAERAVDQYVHELKSSINATPSIDMLILSHLDKDHVNGIDSLLNRVQVKMVFLPYLTPVQRLIVALRHPNAAPWYYEFLATPTQYFIDRDVHKVVLIGGSRRRGSERGFDEDPSLQRGDFPEGEWPRILLEEEDSNKQQNVIREEELKNLVSSGKVSIRSHWGKVMLFEMWEFNIFTQSFPSEKEKLFSGCVSNSFGQNQINIKSLIKKMRNKWTREKIKGCYKYLDKDINTASMVVLHAPKGNYRVYAKLHACYLISPFSSLLLGTVHFPKNSQKFGQLLTGDVNLKHSREEIITRFGKRFPEAVLVQVPHHGSKRSWDFCSRDFHERLRPDYWVIPAGLRNRYRHPHKEVVLDLFQRGGAVLWANERNEVILIGAAKWEYDW